MNIRIALDMDDLGKILAASDFVKQTVRDKSFLVYLETNDEDANKPYAQLYTGRVVIEYDDALPDQGGDSV